MRNTTRHPRSSELPKKANQLRLSHQLRIPERVVLLGRLTAAGAGLLLLRRLLLGLALEWLLQGGCRASFPLLD